MKTSKTAYLLVCIPFSIVGIYFLYLGFIASPDALTNEGYFLKNSYYFEGVVTIIVPFITIVLISLSNKMTKDKEINLIKNGIRGDAEILDMEQTGTYINELPQIKFQLQVTLPGRFPYKIEHEKVVSFLRLNSLYVGAIVTVYVDPNNPERILLR